MTQDKRVATAAYSICVRMGYGNHTKMLRFVRRVIKDVIKRAALGGEK